MIKRLLSAPAVHFVVIGAILYLAQGAWAPAVERAPGPNHRIVVGAATLEDLRETFRRTSGREPNDSEIEALVRDFADSEILYREALARGLDKADRSVRWRLVQKMQFLSDSEESGDSGDADHEALYREALELGLDRDDLVIRRLLIEKMRLLIKLGAVREPPDEESLQAYYEEHAEDYRQPARVSLHHVFLSADKRPDSLRADAEALLEEIRAESLTDDDAIARGDVFPLGHEVNGSSEHNLAKLFGPEFARAAVALPAGSWQGPLASAYGLHIVRIDERHESSLPGLDAVRSQVLQRNLAELREAELRRAMKRLRREYAVSIDADAGTEGS